MGHWALIFPLAGMAVGCIVHATWCRTHDIDPWGATPRERYYELDSDRLQRVVGGWLSWFNREPPAA